MLKFNLFSCTLNTTQVQGGAACGTAAFALKGADCEKIFRNFESLKLYWVELEALTPLRITA